MLIINLVTILCFIIWYFMRFFDLFIKKIQKWQKTVFSQKPCLHPYSITLFRHLSDVYKILPNVQRYRYTYYSQDCQGKFDSNFCYKNNNPKLGFLTSSWCTKTSLVCLSSVIPNYERREIITKQDMKKSLLWR